jgi:thioredoxin reductase (NADPH)
LSPLIGTRIHAAVVAGGLGSFEPRKPLIDGINFYEDKGLNTLSKIQEIQR